MLIMNVIVATLNHYPVEYLQLWEIIPVKQGI